MPTESRQTVHLIDGTDHAALDVSIRPGDIEDGRVVELEMERRVYATLDEVEEFAALLSDFVQRAREQASDAGHGGD